MPKCSQCGKKIAKTAWHIKYGGSAYCNDECFEKTKQFMKEHGIILI